MVIIECNWNQLWTITSHFQIQLQINWLQNSITITIKLASKFITITHSDYSIYTYHFLKYKWPAG